MEKIGGSESSLEIILLFLGLIGFNVGRTLPNTDIESRFYGTCS